MTIGDLAQLSDVKSWLDISTTNDDVTIARLITSASRFIANECERVSFGVRTVAETLSGGLTNKLYLKQYPVISVTALTLNTQAISIQTQPPYGSGYYLDPWDGNDGSGPQGLTIYGSTPIACLANSTLGTNNLTCTYKAGFQTSETFSLASGTPTYSVTRPYASDQGVSYTGGLALVPVASAPALGQYTVSSAGVYTFNASDEVKSLTVTYGYTPQDLNDACIELVGERYKQKGRQGMISQNLGGQSSTTFSQKSMSDFVRDSIQPYVNVAWNQ